MSNTLWIFQLIGIIGIGSFIGEFYRTVTCATPPPVKVFFANFLLIGFLSFWLAWLIDVLWNNKNLSLFIAAGSSALGAQFLINIFQDVLSTILNRATQKGRGDE